MLRNQFEFHKIANGLNTKELESLLSDVVKLNSSISEVHINTVLIRLIESFRRNLIYLMIPYKVTTSNMEALIIKEPIRNFISKARINLKKLRRGSKKLQKLRKSKDFSDEFWNNYSAQIERYSRQLHETREDLAPNLIVQAFLKYDRCHICGAKKLSTRKAELNEYNKGWKTIHHERKRRKLTIDHLNPISGIGANTSDNLVLMCSFCNNIKADTLSDFEFRSSLNYRSHSQIMNNSPLSIQTESTNDNSIIYSVIQRDKKCLICGKDTTKTELTAITRNINKLFLTDNLYTICFDCLKQNSI